MDLLEAKNIADLIIEEVCKAIVGKKEVVKLCVVSLLAKGHILIDDIPGVGKTTLAKALAKAIGGHFKRIQFTPDLLPADITGSVVFNQKENTFEFKEGPIFANVVLADEINRASPKTQASLLECMEEHQVTSDGVTYPLPTPFLLIATENKVERYGIYPLPEAQIDRFMMRISLGYPEGEEEIEILRRHQEVDNLVEHVQTVTDPQTINAIQDTVKQIYVSPSLQKYIVDIVQVTRREPAIILGASPRVGINLQRASQALALIEGRNYVLPDDIKKLFPFVAEHRLVFRQEAQSRSASILKEILERVPVPLLEDEKG